MPDHSVHAGDPNCGKQSANRRRNQADEKRNEHRHRNGTTLPCCVDAVDGERQKRYAHDQKNNGERGEQNIQSDFVRSFLTLCTFDQLYHSIQKSAARLDRHSNHKPIGQDFRSAGNGTPVAAGFANHRRTFTCDCTFIDGRDTFNYFSVRRDHLSCFDKNNVPLFQLRRDNTVVRRTMSRLPEKFCRSVAPRLAQRLRLCLPSSFGNRLSKIRKEYREPEPERNCADEPRWRLTVPAQRLKP